MVLSFTSTKILGFKYTVPAILGNKLYKGAGIYNIKHRGGEGINGEGVDLVGRKIIDRCDVGIPYTYVIRYTGVSR